MNHNRPLDEIVQDLNNKINLLTQSKRDLREKISEEEARANTNNKRGIKFSLRIYSSWLFVNNMFIYSGITSIETKAKI